MLDPVTPPADPVRRLDDDAEVVDAIPVPDASGEPALTPVVRRTGELVSATPIAVHAAAVAVTGFAAGAVAVAAVKRGRRRRTQRFRRKGLAGEIRATHSFLVDVHLLSRD